MNRTVYFPVSDRWCKRAFFFLAGSWCLGLLLGCLAANAGSAEFPVQTMLTASGTMWGAALACGFPVLLSALCFLTGLPYLIPVISFWKAFAFSMLSTELLLACGGAGWMIRSMALFGDCLVCPVLFWFWARFISGRKSDLFFCSASCFSLSLVIGLTDFYTVVPFLAAIGS